MIASPHHVTDQAKLLAEQGNVAGAFELLNKAEQDGDARAALMLADWRLSGALIRRDIKLARKFYGRAVELGLEEIAPIHIAMLANGAGGASRDWRLALKLLRQRAAYDSLAERQLRLIEAMDINEEGDPLASMNPVCCNDTPLVEQHLHFMTPDECHYIIEQASGNLQPSVVFHPVTGRMVQDPIRTARTAAFPIVKEDPVVHAINRRIAKATQTDVSQGEPTQILCYDAGEQYKLHSDALPTGDNQRAKTFLVALNHHFEGGETSFPELGLKLRGKTGDAIHFTNVNSEGSIDNAAKHAGLPVIRGRKYILSKWIRERPLDLTGPPGRPF